MKLLNLNLKDFIEIIISLIIILIIRYTFIEPFRIPSESMKPTLLIGDFIFVNKFIYGINIPIINKKIYINTPEKGDIIVFKHDNKHYIKRLIGTPTDIVIYKNKKIYINNICIKKKYINDKIYISNLNNIHEAINIKEYLNPKKEYHIKNINNQNTKNDFLKIIIPLKSYFVLGDNRDNSEDSRSWGFVTKNKIKGKAFLIWFSININKIDIRWNRLFTQIK